MLLGRGDELDSRKLEAAVLEARDDGTNESALSMVSKNPQTVHARSCIATIVVGSAIDIPGRHQA